MKKISFIIAIIIGVSCISILYPKHRFGSIVDFGSVPPLKLEGKAVVFPFITEIKIGVWEARYNNGQIGEMLEYRWGKASGKYKRFFPNGSAWVDGQYKNGYMYGNWTIYRKDGSVFAKHSGSKNGLPPTEEIFYDTKGNVIGHTINGIIIVDNPNKLQNE
ncbi:MAG: hypothetical protein NT118_09765 [Lentisphaerae bacterium]|nr:hypothetical protein [Lentisphaerota bacterium]